MGRTCAKAISSCGSGSTPGSSSMRRTACSPRSIRNTPASTCRRCRCSEASAGPIPRGPLNYVFQFNVVWEHLPELLTGALLTIQLSASAMALGLCLAILCTYGKSAGARPGQAAIGGRVEAVRHTPLLLHIFIIYFSLPAIGLRLTANSAALLAMVVNLGGYASEILRAGIEAIPHGQIEAARALGLKRLQIFRFIIIFP